MINNKTNIKTIPNIVIITVLTICLLPIIGATLIIIWKISFLFRIFIMQNIYTIIFIFFSILMGVWIYKAYQSNYLLLIRQNGKWKHYRIYESIADAYDALDDEYLNLKFDDYKIRIVKKNRH